MEVLLLVLMKQKDIYTFLLSLKSLSYAEDHMLSPLEIAARRVVRNGTVACSKVHGAKGGALLERCRDTEKKNIRLEIARGPTFGDANAQGASWSVLFNPRLVSPSHAKCPLPSSL